MTTTPQAIVDILNWQRANQGRVPYSETAYTRLDSDTAHLLTATDCSGMVHRMMMHFAGIDVGTYTGNECTHGTLVTVSKSAARMGYGMLPGDCILFDWDGGAWDHIAIYAGEGRIWNHGGPGNGPLNWSLANNVDAAVKVMVRRFIHWPTTPPPPPVHGSPNNPMHGRPVPTFIARGTGDYIGLESGPNESHGGAYSYERPSVLLVEEFLKWKYPALATAKGLVVDGHFGEITKELVTQFQRDYMPGTTYFGQVWFDDWLKMASL